MKFNLKTINYLYDDIYEFRLINNTLLNYNIFVRIQIENLLFRYFINNLYNIVDYEI